MAPIPITVSVVRRRERRREQREKEREREAALLAAKRDKERLDMLDFEDSKDKVYMGLERKSKVIKEEDRLTTAYHEGGHALVARFIPGTDVVNKITIIPRGRAAGVTWFLPEERDFRYKDQLEAELAIAFGGRVAEEIVFKRISTGASNDIKKATDLAQQMIRSWISTDTTGIRSGQAFPFQAASQGDEKKVRIAVAQHQSEVSAARIFFSCMIAAVPYPPIESPVT